MKLTKAQMELIVEHTKKELKGTHQNIATDFGYFQPSGANWCYKAGWTYDGDLVVTCFGEVV